MSNKDTRLRRGGGPEAENLVLDQSVTSCRMKMQKSKGKGWNQSLILLVEEWFGPFTFQPSNDKGIPTVQANGGLEAGAKAAKDSDDCASKIRGD